MELAHSATKTARVLHGGIMGRIPSWHRKALLPISRPRAPAPAPDAAGDAGGDGADSPTGRRPGYKQQLDPGRQMQMLGGPSQAKKWEDLYN